MIDEARELSAVWDAKPARADGGTDDTPAYARRHAWTPARRLSVLTVRPFQQAWPAQASPLNSGQHPAQYHLWHHGVVAMNLRLDGKDSALLKALAQAEHVSLHEAAPRAIRRSARELAHTDQIHEATAEMLSRWSEVPDRPGHT